MLEHWICLTEGAHRVCVDPRMGGHVVEYSVSGKNSLHEKGPVIGSTFWPSPQEAWGWPPPKALDQGPYSAKLTENQIELLSSVCEQTGLQLQKRFTLMSDRLDVTYTMINPGKTTLTYAPWEITRIGGGVTFYQSKEKLLDLSTGPAEYQDGYVWHTYDVNRQNNQNQKLFGNGSSGWLANVHKGLLIIKQFEPLSVEKVAPGEAEIEIYGHGDSSNPYIEIEQQGIFASLNPGAKMSWTVSWYLKELTEEEERVRQKWPSVVERILSP